MSEWGTEREPVGDSLGRATVEMHSGQPSGGGLGLGSEGYRIILFSTISMLFTVP